MKDFLDGMAVRISSNYIMRNEQKSGEAVRRFLRMCNEYGLRWADGTKSIDVPFGGATFIMRDMRTGAMICTDRPGLAGPGRRPRYKAIDEVRPLQHTFGQFLRGEFALHIEPRDIGDFIEICTKNRVLWQDDQPPRAGLKGKHFPISGFYAVIVSRYGGPRMKLFESEPIRVGGSEFGICSFRYIPRNYESPSNTTLSKAKSIERAARDVAKAAKDAVAQYTKIEPTPQPSPLRTINRASESQSILITVCADSNTTKARIGKSGERCIGETKATCGPDDKYNFATGAMIALARLLGEAEWREAAKEVLHMFARDRSRAEHDKRWDKAASDAQRRKEIKAVIDEVSRYEER